MGMVVVIKDGLVSVALLGHVIPLIVMDYVSLVSSLGLGFILFRLGIQLL